jgi:hypothetical protein
MWGDCGGLPKEYEEFHYAIRPVRCLSCPKLLWWFNGSESCSVEPQPGESMWVFTMVPLSTIASVYGQGTTRISFNCIGTKRTHRWGSGQAVFFVAFVLWTTLQHCLSTQRLFGELAMHTSLLSSSPGQSSGVCAPSPTSQVSQHGCSQ